MPKTSKPILLPSKTLNAKPTLASQALLPYLTIHLFISLATSLAPKSGTQVTLVCHLIYLSKLLLLLATVRFSILW